MFGKVAFGSVLGSAIAAVYVAGAFATPGSGFTSVDISKGRFQELAVNTTAEDPNLVRLEAKGSLSSTWWKTPSHLGDFRAGTPTLARAW
jgi:hypothetical protein